jgi:hypothetical protein
MKVLWGRAVWDDFRDWYGSDAQAFEKIFQLVADIQRDPFRGVGQPEPLKGKTFQVGGRGGSITGSTDLPRRRQRQRPDDRDLGLQRALRLTISRVV